MFDDRELAVLEKRAADAFDTHMDGYTASAVLHDIFMDILGQDEKGIEAIRYVQSLLKAHRDKTLAEWLTAQDLWLFAAGIAYDTNFDDDEDEANH
ncbi:hypothetical protein ThrDRAFT_04186 [Frankia casuarinae]|uniref:Uncharacterized protein n=1 Tax=Frankia casuarinae (strain DSM 45818 / CECT 9043 / HFP020203 / CcI3) TaxID=106370 RepID=Q2JGR2_FRACC|nr:hypothetical protein Francci3_0136 [Frankia casuarinae]ESZ99833.1 hypothetical protein CcI6DRAFT_04755 [Frankia sp. CcI6]KDA40424.1 hypothetical protein BMG523Draft_04772 [Frankia sp. BMG5.23]KFB04632.1 hypothetical protein ALLO2DRAFT_02561 [Frankia sp. Allo2]OHV48275.1 hypothetical protein CgIS1_21830 [Frankia sp. CgIS1]